MQQEKKHIAAFLKHSILVVLKANKKEKKCTNKNIFHFLIYLVLNVEPGIYITLHCSLFLSMYFIDLRILSLVKKNKRTFFLKPNQKEGGATKEAVAPLTSLHSIHLTRGKS